MLTARILVVLGVLLAALSLLAGYIRFQALDTPTVKKTAGKLIADDQIRDQVATSLVDQLYANVDVPAELAKRLPPDQKGLAGPLSAALREFSNRAAQRLLERPQVQALWVETVTRAHTQLINVLEDDTRGFSTENGEVVLDLQPLMIQLGERVAIFGAAAQQFGPDAGRIEIMQADQLETAQNLTQLLKILGTWLWLLPITCWAIALWLAGGRRRSILRMVAIGSILVGLLVLVVRRLAGSSVVDTLAPSTSRATCRPRRLGHPDQPAPRRRLHVPGPRGDPARSALAGRTVPEGRLRAPLACAVPGEARDRLRGRRRALPAPPLVEPNRPDDEGAADVRGRAHFWARGRVASTPDGPRGSRPAARVSGSVRRLRGCTGH